jgi:hypothetical protein
LSWAKLVAPLHLESMVVQVIVECDGDV